MRFAFVLHPMRADVTCGPASDSPTPWARTDHDKHRRNWSESVSTAKCKCVKYDLKHGMSRWDSQAACVSDFVCMLSGLHSYDSGGNICFSSDSSKTLSHQEGYTWQFHAKGSKLSFVNVPGCIAMRTDLQRVLVDSMPPDVVKLDHKLVACLGLAHLWGGHGWPWYLCLVSG